MQRGEIVSKHRRRQLVKLRDATSRQPLEEPAKSVFKLMGRSSASMPTDEVELGDQPLVAHRRANRQLGHHAPPIGEAGSPDVEPSGHWRLCVRRGRCTQRSYLSFDPLLRITSGCGYQAPTAHHVFLITRPDRKDPAREVQISTLLP